MSVLKCKMCGGTLALVEGSSIAVCDYCGSHQTLPKLNSQKLENLYDRANHFRMNNDYDKAMSIYEQILIEDNTDADTYWSIVLCRYGIEYVEEPGTRKRVPTINRTQYTSIFADVDYKSAIKYADAEQCKLYENEAKIIDEIQKGILAISQNEAPFDIFICYKESDQSGRRTQDSVLSNELYHQLTKEGFKVFFSRITLEDKLGTAYEPYIFSALNSAKIMIALGTKPDYFESVWVKNEWSRYLAMIKKGDNKILIPAYKDMDPYDLPDAFSHLQALDMNKLGFMQDLIHAIKKILIKEEPTTVESNIMVQNTVISNIDSLYKRALMFWEDGDKNKADEYAERILDLDPEYGQAYLLKLLLEHNCHSVGALINYLDSYQKSSNFSKFEKYADKKTKQEFYQLLERAKEKKRLKKNEEDYVKAMKAKEESSKSNLPDKIQNYAYVATMFQNIGNYKDALKQAEICKKESENAVNEYIQYEYKQAIIEMKSCNSREEYLEVAKKFRAAKEFFEDAEVRAKECYALADECSLRERYNEACKLIKRNNHYRLMKAIEAFEKLNGYNDSKEKIDYCKKLLLILKIKKICSPLIKILVFILILIILYIWANYYD